MLDFILKNLPILPILDKVLVELKNLAELENWDYIKKPTRGVPVLFGYLLIKQDKIIKGKSSKDNTEYADFNKERKLIAIPLSEIITDFNKMFNAYRELLKTYSRH